MSSDQTNFHFSQLQSGLQSRSIVAPLPSSVRPWQAVYLLSGGLSITTSHAHRRSEIQIVEAPAFICWPTEDQHAFRLLAGSSGVQLALGEMFLVTVLGKRPEAAELRDMASRFLVVPLNDFPESEARIRAALGEISQEHNEGAAGQFLVIEAQLRCLIVQVWRHALSPEEQVHAPGQQTAILRKFRQLVETHFHDRWRVADYAAALNITTDRLHNIATQTLNKTPIELIHDRTQREAKALLTRTNMTLDQIAADLSFKTTPQFNAFFRKLEGVPPGRFRAQAAKGATDAAMTAPLDLGEWP